MASVEKGRYAQTRTRRLYPLGTFNSWCARPLSALLASMRFTPNAVSGLSFLASAAGVWAVMTGAWRWMVLGAALVHLGLLLDHADGQVARRRGLGSTWGMYVDMVIDRLVEVGLIIAMAGAVVQGVRGVPDAVPAVWQPVSAGSFLVLLVATLGVMMTWRFVGAYNDILFLRSHLMATGRMPAEDAQVHGVAKRPLMPLVFSRDWVLAFWVVGVVLAQLQALALLLLATHCLVLLEKIIVFRVRHPDPEGDARRILGKDYH